MPNFTDLILISPRITLTPVTPKYAKDICTHFTPEVTRYMWPSAPKSQEEINQHISHKQIQMQKGEEIALVIAAKDTNEFLGYISVHKVNSSTPELGIWLKQEAQGHRYAYDAMSLLKNWLEQHLTYDYLTYPVDKKNLPSRKLAEKLGGIVEAEYIKTSESGNLLDEVEYRFQKNPHPISP